eukprot:802233-Prymnesium_polylepis.3
MGSGVCSIKRPAGVWLIGGAGNHKHATKVARLRIPWCWRLDRARHVEQCPLLSRAFWTTSTVALKLLLGALKVARRDREGDWCRNVFAHSVAGVL